MSMIVDIRSEEDYQKRHNLRSLRIAPDEMYTDCPSLRIIQNVKPEELLIMADNYQRAEEFKGYLASLSWQPNVKVYEGGMDAWIAEGKPYISYPVLFGNLRLNPPVFFLGLFAMLLLGLYIVSLTLMFS